MENAAGGDVLPLDGSNTVTCAVPTTARSAAGIEATSLVVLVNVVTRSAPFHRTIDPDVNELPLTVRVKAPPPAGAAAGESELMTGGPGSTVTAGLVARRVYPLFANNRNSYVPGVAGAFTVQVRVVTPGPT